MNPVTFWKNFNLGSELSVSGSFIYNGIRGFHEMKSLNYEDETFHVFYDLAVGLERLLKIAVVLLEHDEEISQSSLEESLKTHNLSSLLERIKKHHVVPLGRPHYDLLELLTNFYKSSRYSRFSLSSAFDFDGDVTAIKAYLKNQLNEEIGSTSHFIAIENKLRYKKFLRKTVLKISSVIYEIIKARSSSLNIYTYEQRHRSKGQTVFLGEFDPVSEDILWKELLLFMMNEKSTSGYLGFLKGIEPLGFDPALMSDYLDCFQSDSAKSEVMDELNHLYDELEPEDRKGRLEIMSVIGSSGVYFDFPEDEMTGEESKIDEL